MRIVFLTNSGFVTSEKFRYTFAHVASSFPDVHIVAVRFSHDQSKSSGLHNLYQKGRKVLWRIRRFGVLHALELHSSTPLRRLIYGRHEREVDNELRMSTRPPIEPHPEQAVYTDTLNGPDAVEAINRLAPDVIVQVDAGILKRRVFDIARIGTLNLHRGIAPLIKGQDPMYWALWNPNRGWMGVTLHYIDDGIDTGPVLAYEAIEPRYPGERFPSLYAYATLRGVERLVEALHRLSRGERWAVRAAQGERVYRSHFSGWRLLILEIRLAVSRYRAALEERRGSRNRPAP